MIDLGGMRRLLAPLGLALSLLLGGCALDARTVGGPCLEELDCSSGSFCLRRATFPEGTCTTNCSPEFECRGDTRCVDIEGGVCLLPCETDADCERDGYGCREIADRRGPGTLSVCIGG